MPSQHLHTDEGVGPQKDLFPEGQEATGAAQVGANRPDLALPLRGTAGLSHLVGKAPTQDPHPHFPNLQCQCQFCFLVEVTGLWSCDGQEESE